MASKKKKGKAIQFQIGWAGLIAIVVSCVCVLLWTFVLGFWMGQKVANGPSSGPKVSVYSPKKQTEIPSVQARFDQVEKEVKIGPDEEQTLKEFSAIKEKLKQEAREQGDNIKTEVLPGPKTEKIASDIVEKSPSSQVSKESKPKEDEGAKEAAAEKKEKKEEKPSKKKQTKKIKTEKVSEEASQISRPFALQIASYRTIIQARKEAKRWKNKGYFVRIRSANLGRKGVWYRVYLGRYKSVDEAKRASVRLAQKEGIRSYVTKVSK